MASKRTHDVVATTGTYEKNGETKKRYTNVGSAFTDDQGRISIKLDAVPVTPEWTGWLSLYEPKDQGRDRTAAEGRGQAPGRTAAHSNNQPKDYDDESDTIPF